MDYIVRPDVGINVHSAPGMDSPQSGRLWQGNGGGPGRLQQAAEDRGPHPRHRREVRRTSL